MINRKMRNIASVKNLDPKEPLKNKQREAILQYMLAHPEKDQATICKAFNHSHTYISKLLSEAEFAQRYAYLQRKIGKKLEEHQIWSAEKLLTNLQKRIEKTKSDNTYVIGCGLIGKFIGLDKQINILRTENTAPINIVFQEVVKKETAKE